MESTESLFHRNELLLGKEAAVALYRCHIILFGVGGVGSWCAEALIRSGVGHLTLVDPDTICSTNLNRQLQATCPDIGKYKVDVLQKRLLQINPDATIASLQISYNEETSKQFDFNTFDYVIDAIDSLSAKVALLVQAMQSRATLYSAMGAANKLNPALIRTGSIWETKQCPLARFVRKRLRRYSVTGDFTCVYSTEVSEPRKEEEPHGSMVHISGTFGFFLAGLVVQDQQMLNSKSTEL